MKRVEAELWAVGVDLGGTKIKVAQVDAAGRIYETVQLPTRVGSGPAGIVEDIVRAVRRLVADAPHPPAGVGVGVPGQISPGGGVVYFAPNLNWVDVPLQADLSRALLLDVTLTNDVRAATVGEWLHGAGKGHDDIVCLFVGTGIGGGIVSGGRLISGCSNNAGELGHIPVDLNGPLCHCGNRGCLEAAAGGWAIARRAQEAVVADPVAGAAMVEAAGGSLDKVTGGIVTSLYRQGDALATRLVDETTVALGAGASGLVNAFNPSRMILGGGVIEGLPELVHRVEDEVGKRALRAATTHLKIVRAALGGNAGVVGAAAVAMSLVP